MVGTWSAEIIFLPLPHLGSMASMLGPVSPKRLYMAIIRSLAIGKGRKSAGNLTFRTVRGRTIVSEKVGKRENTRAGISKRAFIFGLITRFAAQRAADIAASFEPTKYGSPRNAFVKYNYSSLYKALEGLFVEGLAVWDVTDSQISEAVTAYALANPESIYRVKMGSTIEYLAGEWPANAGATARLTLPFTIAGKTIVGGTYLGASLATQDAVVLIPVVNGELVTSVTGAEIRYIVEDGSDVSVAVPLSDVQLIQNEGKFYVSGKLSAAIPQGEYELQVSVASSEIKNTVSVANVWFEENPIESVTFNQEEMTDGGVYTYSTALSSKPCIVHGQGFNTQAPTMTVDGSNVALNVTDDETAQGVITLPAEGTHEIVISLGAAKFSFTAQYQA